MNKLILIIVSLISVNALLGSGTKDESFIRTIPILEVAGDRMPGWEKQIIEQYGDEEGNPQPVIFRGAAKNWEAATWTPEYFAERFGDVEIVVIPPKVFEEAINYDKENLEKTSIMDANTTIRDHINDITLNPKNAYYFLGDLYYNSTKEELKEDDEDELIRNAIFMHDYLNLESQTRFPQAIAKAVEADRRSYNVFIGAGNTVTSLHNHDSTFLAQIYGKKLATLIHPKYKNKCYCEFGDEEEDKVARCAIDILKPDFEKYPEARDIEIYQTILEAGDVLYIPKGWLHDIRGLSTSISIAGGF